jgi:hypothetical protein
MCRQNCAVDEVDERASKLRAAVRATIEVPTSTVRAHNRLYTVVGKELDLLDQSKSGRDLLELLTASDPDVHVRIFCANRVMRWAPEVARRSLEQIVSEAGGTVVYPMTMKVALEAPWGVGSSAALSLLNLHDERFIKQTPLASELPRSEGSVPSAQLDAAERLYGLAMNGGLQHAFDVAKEDFPEAFAALDAVGATDAAAAFRQAFELLSSDPLPSLNEDLAVLDSALSDEPVMDYLEAAAEE